MSVRSIGAATIALLLFAGACRQAEKSAPVSADAVNRVSTRAVVLYFEGTDGLLAPERREMPLPESEAAAIHPLVAALVAGPKSAALSRLFPDGTIVRGAFVLPEGIAVVDLGGPVLQEGWQTGSHAELAAAFGLVQTLVANLPSVRRVQILVGGEVVQTLGGHLDLAHPLRPMPALIAGKAPARAAASPPAQTPAPPPAGPAAQSPSTP